MEIVAHDFAPRDTVAGHPVLDFVNTVTARDAAVPRDWLDSYTRLLDWAALARLLSAGSLEALRAMAGRSPHRAAYALARARAFREGLHDACAAVICAKPPPHTALQTIEVAWKKAASRSALCGRRSGAEPVLDVEHSGLDLVVDTLALQAIELLSTFPAERVRVCAGPNCGWLFIDTSKGGRRIWCDMATCGNDAKGRRHRARQRRN